MVRAVTDGNARVEPGHRVPTTLVLSLAAVAAALIAIFGSDDSITAVTIGAALAGLVPWTLVAGGVHVPVPIFAAMTLACAAVVLVVDVNPGGMFPVMLMVVWVCRATGDWRIHATVLAIGLGLLVVTTVREKSAHEAGLVYFTGGLGISWLTGMMLRRQESLTVELQAMNELRVEHAATAERARIAREVHDVVAHSLTVMVLHLAGARRAMATEPARAAEALARAETVGRDSLESIREVMGLLRDDGAGRGAAQPGLADLGPLIDGYRIAGLAVVVGVDEALGLDPTADLVVYRVVQESLTNVLRHAPGAACSVSVRSTGVRSIEVDVVNGLAPAHHGVPARGPTRGSDSELSVFAGSGLGVRGMIERVRAVRGDLVAGPDPGGGWRVTATIPTGDLRSACEVANADEGRATATFPHRVPTEPEVAWPQQTVP